MMAQGDVRVKGPSALGYHLVFIPAYAMYCVVRSINGLSQCTLMGLCSVTVFVK